jgi:hypothetical protein
LRLHLVGSLIGKEEETVSLPFAPRWRRVVGVAICPALLAACGSDSDESDTATPPTRPSISFPSTLSTSPPIVTDNDPAKAAPRWEQVRVVTGNAPMDLGAIKIASGAIQWRVKWDCEAGAMRITTTPPAVPTRPGPLVDSRCPGSGEGFGRQTGDVRVNVEASGPWKATFEQQVDTPLDEPPLPEMANARVLARGDFYNVDKTGKGTAILYQLPDGRRALRIEPGFEVLNDPDLVIWLSSVPNPRTARAMAEGPHVELAALKSTRGSQNYIIPDNLPIPEIRSIGLYCVPVPSIYIAAALS